MCGIIGYIGDKPTVPIIIEGLHKLEYRGYDSSGICISNNKELITIKRRGKVSELSSNKEIYLLDGESAIAHTRWATHGEPNETNAHPHLDCKKEIAIVHNGIIENYKELKEILEKEGHIFVSQTDSEVISHLIEKFYHGDLKKAVLEAILMLEGTFGLVVLNKEGKNIIATRRGSPLILGIGNKEMFVTSDSSAILNHTNKVIYLKDNEIAEIEKDKYNISTIEGKEVYPEVNEIKTKIEQINKGNYDSFMLKEIFEQPESISNALRGRLKNEEIKLTLNFDIEKIKRIIILGCGTSWHSALIGKSLIEKLVKIPVEVDYSSEFRYRNPILSNEDLVVLISQSGETADTLAALKESKAKGAKTMGIVNVVGSTIARDVDSGIYIHAGPEISVASTKAFTSQITNLLLFALYLKSKLNPTEKTILYNELTKLPKLIEETLKSNEKIKEIAEKYKNNKNFIFLSRGINFPVALEGALKLKEISYLNAEGYPAGEMKHGPIALVDSDLVSIFIANHNSTYDKTISNIQEIKARKGKIIVLTDLIDEKIKNLADDIILVPKTEEELSPIINSIPLQLFAHHMAKLKGLDIDKPRNLAKSVTVE